MGVLGVLEEEAEGKSTQQLGQPLGDIPSILAVAGSQMRTWLDRY